MPTCAIVPRVAQAKFDASLKLLRTMPPEPAFPQRAVHVTNMTGLRSKSLRAFVSDKDFVAKFSVSPNKVGITSFEYMLPSGQTEVECSVGQYIAMASQFIARSHCPVASPPRP